MSRRSFGLCLGPRRRTLSRKHPQNPSWHYIFRFTGEAGVKPLHSARQWLTHYVWHPLCGHALRPEALPGDPLLHTLLWDDFCCGKIAIILCDLLLRTILLPYHKRCCLQAQKDGWIDKGTRGSSRQKTIHTTPWQEDFYRYICAVSTSWLPILLLFLLHVAIYQLAACVDGHW